MNRINNKNLIIFGVVVLALFFSVVPNHNVNASTSDAVRCSKKNGVICGYDREITRNQNYPTYVPSPNYDPYACRTSGYTCGGGIDQTVRPQVLPGNTYQSATSNPKPVINAVSPNSAKSGSGEIIVTIYGMNFVPSSVAKLNSSDRATTYLDKDKLRIRLTEVDLNGSGEYLITVFNPLPGGGFSNAEFFTIVGGPTEVKSSVEEESNLGAAAILGGDGFFPRSFMGWLLLSIFILLGVVLWRKLYVSGKDRHAPLKHA